MRKFLSLMMVMFAAVTLAFADDPVQIASGTFNGKNASYTEGWTTTGTGKSRTDCIIIGAGENITSPSIDLSAYDSISITFKGRRYGSLSGSKATVSVAYGANELGTIDITSSSVGNVAGNIGYKVPANLATSAFVFTCTNATSAGSTHGAGIGTITITGIEKTTTPDPDPQPTTQTLYCQISESWASWPAKYAVYYFKDETDNGWSEFMTAVEGETNLYTTTIPTGYTSVIFVRLDGAATEANWDNKWSQTVNLTIPEGKNLFTVTSGDQGSECDGVWAKYPVVPTYYVAGTMTSWADNMVEMNEGSYTFEDLAAGKYEIKVVDNNSNWLGFDKLNTTASNKNVYGEGTGNIKFVLGEEGDVTVAYDGAKITVTGATIVAPTTVFTVTVPEGTEKAFIAGNFTKWAPVEMTLKEENVFTYSFAGDVADTASYKYLAGPAWKYVEINADDTEKENRGYNAADEVAKWAAVPVALKYAKVTKAPINWTGHYIISYGDLKPHSAISGSDFVAAADAPAFVDGDTISVAEGFDIEIRFSETAGAYTIKLPSEKYIKLPSSNAVNEDETAMALYMGYFAGENQEGVQIADNADLTATGTRMMYKNNNYYRSYTNKIDNASYKLPTLYRLVDEAFDCQDGPYGVLINGKDVVVAEALAGEEEYDAAGRKQYRAYLNLGKDDIIQIVNTSCGSAWLPAIEEGGMSAHFDADDEMAIIDTTGCFDLYIKMKEGDDKLYIGAGICPEDTIRFTVVGDGEALGDWDLAEGLQSKENTLEVNLKAGDYKLKVVDQNNFWFGFEQLSEVAEGLKSLDDDKNIGFTLKEDGKVTFTLIKTATDTTFTLAGNFYYYQPTLVDLKLVPGVWAEADAKIAAWAWTRKEGAEMVDQWTPFFAPIAEGNDTLSVKIDAAADSIQFIRFNKAVESPVWSDAEDVIWNRLASDSIVKESMTYTITDWAAGTWDVYVPAKYYIVGDSALVGSKDLAWNPAAIKVTEDSKVLDLEAGSYMMKITLKGDWEHGVLGYDALTGEKPAGITRGEGDNNDNICFTLKEAGQVTVSYIATETDTTFTVAGNFYYYQPTLVDLKLVPGVWAEADAKIAAWAWTRKEGAEMVDQWTPFFAPIAEGNDTLSVKIDAAADSILFVRFNNEATVPTWDGGEGYIWGQMSNDSIVKESMTYTITDWAAGTWDVYVPAKFYVTGDSALVTDAGFAGKAWNADAIKSENDTLVLNLKADQDYILKVAVNGTWEGENNVKGYNELSEKTEGLLDIGNDHNIGFRLNAAGEVKVVYIAAEGENPEIFKLIGDFYVAPAPDPTVSVKGSMNDWAEEIPFVLSDDKTYASLTVENIGADNYDFKFIINGEWRSNGYTYHRDFPGAAGITENNDANMVFQADVDGEYTFYWYFANDSAAIVYPEKPEPVMDDGYYIIGLNGWNVADLTEDDMFWSTGIETNEFSINLTLRLNDEFKVVRIVDDMIQEWYPAEGGNYVVDDHHYGATTVYFRPNYDGNEDWFARCIYVLPTSTVDIDILDTNAPAVKILRDGQILIIKGTKTFNIQGQLVK